MKTKSFLLCLSVVALLISACSPTPPSGTIELSKTQFAPNEEIKIKFTTTGAFGERPWIGIIPSAIPHGNESENDNNDLSYQYFDGLVSGELTFNAPQNGGDFDFRMHTSDNDGIEVTSVSFKVVAPKVDVSLSTDKTEYKTGEQIVITFTAPAEFETNAWIGLIPSATPHGTESDNDAADIAYEHLSKRTSGEIKFTAPSEAGSFDIRMNDSDSDGKEVASKTITIIK